MYRISKPTCREVSITLPPSKSLTHRGLILAGLNEKTSVIKNLLKSDDTTITLESLNRFGMETRLTNESDLTVTRPVHRVRTEKINLGNSGSSARFLLPLPAFLDRPVSFYGNLRLHERPLHGLLQALTGLGGKIESANGTLPVRVLPRALAGGQLDFGELPSSQFISSLLMSALWMKTDLSIALQDRVPAMPYIDMTIAVMRNQGAEVERVGNRIYVRARKPSLAWNFRVERDFSAAAYWVAFALLSGTKVALEDISVSTLQGDARILSIAEEIGATVRSDQNRIQIEGEIERGLTVDCFDTPDLVPVLSVLAMFAPEPSRLLNVRYLSTKESDRILSIQTNLKALGADSEFDQDILTIIPQQAYRPAVIDVFNDHRVAMSFAMAGIRIPGLIIRNPECVSKSYPDFWRDFSFWENQEA